MSTSAEVNNCSQLNFTNKTCYELSKYDFESTMWASTGVSILAAAACCMAIAILVYFKLYKKYVHRLALYINVADLVNAVFAALRILPTDNQCGHVIVKHKPLCKALGFLEQYSNSVMLLFIFWITVYLVVLTLFKRHYKSQKLEVASLITCLIISLVISIIPLIDMKNGMMYGFSDTSCFIKLVDDNCRKYEDGIIEIYAIGYGPLVFFATLNFIAVLVMVVVLCNALRIRDQLHSQYKKALKEALPLLLYPIFFATLLLLCLVDLIHYTNKTTHRFATLMTHAVAGQANNVLIPLAFLHLYILKKLNCQQIQRD